MHLTRLSSDVYLAARPVVAIGAEDVAVLAKAVDESSRGRVRINMHPGADDPLHDMIIAIRQDSYIRPHKHLNKSETFHLVQGVVDVITFNDGGEIQEIVQLAAAAPPRAFCYRMSAPLFHTLVIRSSLLVVHEITSGPFRPEDTVFADFAPDEADAAAVADYQATLQRRVSERLAA